MKPHYDCSEVLICSALFLINPAFIGFLLDLWDSKIYNGCKCI